MEMHEPPFFKSESRNDVYLQKESPDNAAYKEIFCAIGGQWLWFGRLLLTEDQLAEKLHSPHLELYVLRGIEDHGLLGMAEIDFSQSGEAEIVYFGLVADAIGKGLGRFLMTKTLEIAWQRDISVVKLNTNDLDHISAREFYRRSGFNEVRTQQESFPDPRDVGLLPKDYAPQIPINRDGL